MYAFNSRFWLTQHSGGAYFVMSSVKGCCKTVSGNIEMTVTSVWDLSNVELMIKDHKIGEDYVYSV